MKIPYFDPSSVQPGTPEAEACATIAARRRREGGLIELDKALLHSPQMALSYSNFLGQIRSHSIIPGHIRELIMCRVAVLNGSRYEWDQHFPLFCEELGALLKGETKSKELIERIEYYILETSSKSIAPTAQQSSLVEFASETDIQVWRAVIRLTDALTLTDFQHDHLDEVWTDVMKQLELNDEGTKHRMMVELTMCIAAYNMVSRFLVALDVGEVGQWDPVARISAKASS